MLHSVQSIISAEHHHVPGCVTSAKTLKLLFWFVILILDAGSQLLSSFDRSKTWLREWATTLLSVLFIFLLLPHVQGQNILPEVNFAKYSCRINLVLCSVVRLLHPAHRTTRVSHFLNGYACVEEYSQVSQWEYWLSGESSCLGCSFASVSQRGREARTNTQQTETRHLRFDLR